MLYTFLLLLMLHLCCYCCCYCSALFVRFCCAMKELGYKNLQEFGLSLNWSLCSRIFLILILNYLGMFVYVVVKQLLFNYKYDFLSIKQSSKNYFGKLVLIGITLSSLFFSLQMTISFSHEPQLKNALIWNQYLICTQQLQTNFLIWTNLQCFLARMCSSTPLVR